MAELIAKVGRALARLGRTVFARRSETTGTETPPRDGRLSSAARPVLEVRALLSVRTGRGGGKSGRGQPGVTKAHDRRSPGRIGHGARLLGTSLLGRLLSVRRGGGCPARCRHRIAVGIRDQRPRRCGDRPPEDVGLRRAGLAELTRERRSLRARRSHHVVHGTVTGLRGLRGSRGTGRLVKRTIAYHDAAYRTEQSDPRTDKREVTPPAATRDRVIDLAWSNGVGSDIAPAVNHGPDHVTAPSLCVRRHWRRCPFDRRDRSAAAPRCRCTAPSPRA